MIRYDAEKVRDVQLAFHPEYRLQVWDLNERKAPAHHRLGYRLTKGQEVLFEGDDFGCSPMHAVDSNEALVGLLGFLTLKPGDTDEEYFENYTARQLEWAESEAEELSCYGCDTPGMFDRFINLEDIDDED